VVTTAPALNRAELRRYLERISDRWPIDVALLGGARVDDERGAPEQRERGPEFIVVLVSDAYGGMPWLERVYVAGSLWDGYEMGERAEVHCYTHNEYARRRASMPIVRRIARDGLDLTELP
jgi:hypothetical protein